MSLTKLRDMKLHPVFVLKYRWSLRGFKEQGTKECFAGDHVNLGNKLTRKHKLGEILKSFLRTRGQKKTFHPCK